MMLRVVMVTRLGSWFNEVGVSMTATVSATPHDKILADPLVKDGLPEASMIVLPRAKLLEKESKSLPRLWMKKVLLKGILLS